MSTTNAKVTLVCLFHDNEYARAAVRDLMDSGVPREEIFEIGGPDHLGSAAEGSEIGTDIGRFHLPKNEVDMLTEGLDNGGTLVAVETGEERASLVESIFEKNMASKVDEKSKDDSGVYPSSAAPVESSEAHVIPVTEEELSVGKRQIQTGRARIYTRVVETPTEQTVRLREEHARIERRPVDRLATDADLEAFRDRSIQVDEIVEEPVVSKTARVVEEVVVGKDATERTEHITDSVRKTEVEVERIDGKRGA